MDRLKQQLGDSVIVLAGASGGKVALVAGVNGSPTGKVKAGNSSATSPVRSAARAVAVRISPRVVARRPALATALDGVPWVKQHLG